MIKYTEIPSTKPHVRQNHGKNVLYGFVNVKVLFQCQNLADGL